jgi:hypothetical protein
MLRHVGRRIHPRDRGAAAGYGLGRLPVPLVADRIHSHQFFEGATAGVPLR